MKSALFTNWTTEEFSCAWDGKIRKYNPNESEYLPDSLAQHYAKHLTNRELLRKDSNGNYIYKDGEKATSPKFPEQNPIYMQLFNKAYTPGEQEIQGTDRRGELDATIESLNKNKAKDKSEELQTPIDDDDFIDVPVDPSTSQTETPEQIIETPENVDDKIKRLKKELRELDKIKKQK